MHCNTSVAQSQISHHHTVLLYDIDPAPPRNCCHQVWQRWVVSVGERAITSARAARDANQQLTPSTQCNKGCEGIAQARKPMPTTRLANHEHQLHWRPYPCQIAVVYTAMMWTTIADPCKTHAEEARFSKTEFLRKHCL